MFGCYRPVPYRGGMKDTGLFGPHSVTWRIHADPVMLIGGLRALLLQALHPVAMSAVAENSDFRRDPWGRLRRTTEYLVATIYGDEETARRAAARVRALHRRVGGVDPTTGRGYRADDPDLLLWVHAVEVQSFLTAYRHYAHRISQADADRYVSEMVVAAELVGLHREDVPATWDDLESCIETYRDRLLPTPAAREGLRLVLAPPMPLPARPLWGIPVTAAIAVLPAFARRAYGLPWIPAANPAVRAAVTPLFRLLNVAVPPPPPVRAALRSA